MLFDTFLKLIIPLLVFAIEYQYLNYKKTNVDY